MEESHNTKSVSLSIPFSSSDTASLVQEVLDVDKELKSSGIQRQISTVGVNLQVKFHGNDLKKIRVAVNSLIKSVLLIIKTIDIFP